MSNPANFSLNRRLNRLPYNIDIARSKKKANEIIVKAFRKLSPSTLYNRNDHNAVNSRES